MRAIVSRGTTPLSTEPQVGIEPTTARRKPSNEDGSSPRLVLSTGTETHGTSADDGSGPSANSTHAALAGRFRWVVFQVTRKGKFRLTRWLRADTKADAEQIAAARYVGCAGTLEVVSAAELSVIVDDHRACARTRIAPVPEGARRPNVRRGVSFGACVYCGAVTTAPGGKAPKYCPAHRDKLHQRAYRVGQLSMLVQLVPGQAVRA